MSDEFLGTTLELNYYKALVTQLQWELDERNKLVAQYERLVNEALEGIKKLTREVHDAGYASKY